MIATPFQIIPFIYSFPLLASFLYSYFGTVSVFPQCAHSWVVEFQYHNRGHRNTRLCTSNVFNMLLFIPCPRFLLVSAYHSSSPLSPPPSTPADAASAALAPNRSSPSCYHHLLEIHAPGLCTIFSQKSIIGYVAVYYTTVFCLFRKYAPISSTPYSSISISRGGYSQIPSSH